MLFFGACKQAANMLTNSELAEIWQLLLKLLEMLIPECTAHLNVESTVYNSFECVLQLTNQNVQLIWT